MKWFGSPWPSDWRTHGRAPVCEDEDNHVETPLGRDCFRCEQPIEDGDQGVVIPHYAVEEEVDELPWHIECFLQEIGLPSAYKLH